MGPVAYVFVLVASRATTFVDVGRMLPTQHLQRLLVDADDDGSLGWPQVEVTNALGLHIEVRVGGLEPLTDLVRSQAFEAKDSADLANTNTTTGLSRQRVRRRSVRPQVAEHDGSLRLFRALTGQLHQPAAQMNADHIRPPGALQVFESLDVRVLGEPGLPLANRPRGDAQLVSDLGCPQATQRHEDDSAAHHEEVRRSLAPHQQLQVPANAS